jgi:Flp pilus assembly protein TadG
MTMTRRRKGSRGGVLVEFAFASIVLVPMIMGTFSFGLAFRNYSNLLVSVRNAARYASLQDYDSWTTTPSTAYITRVRNMVMYGNPEGGTAPLVTGLQTSHIVVSIQMYANTPRVVTVSVSGYPLVDFAYPITLDNKPSVSFRYMGRFAPPIS